MTIIKLISRNHLYQTSTSTPLSADGEGLHYVYTDHLGSILAITDDVGSIVVEQNFDPWGRKRNPVTWEYDSVPDLPFWLIRGFTAHEMLDEFQLIHMNGRLYDPNTGTMLSPDNFVQNPFYTQSYNRYAYAFNNPLRYTDPSGEFFVADSWAMGFVAGFFSTGSGRLNAAWNGANHRARMDARIWGGLFVTDPNRQGGGGRIGEFVSRFTWQLPQTIGGFVTAHAYNTFGFAGGVQSVEYAYGATAVTTRTDDYFGVTQGSYIVGSSHLAANADNTLFQHEYGHYLQSQGMGFAYYNVIGIPSLRSARSSNHRYTAVEQDANRRAFIYFNANVKGFQDDVSGSGYGTDNRNVLNQGWNFAANPLAPNGEGSELYIDASNSNSISQLNRLAVVSAGFWDYAAWGTMLLVPPFNVVGPIFSGMIKRIR